MNSTIFNLKMKVLQASLLMSTLFMLTACGSTTATSSGSAISADTSTLATATATPVGNIYDLPDAPTFVADINGVSGKYPSASPSFAITTSRTLKVRVTPLSAPNLRLAGYTNWVFPYGCLQMTVTVNGVVKQTEVLQVAGVTQPSTSICATAPTFQVLDFSNDMSGNGNVSVTISNAVYDNCRYVTPLTYGCGMSAIFQTHEAEADITVETDDTYMDETAAN